MNPVLITFIYWFCELKWWIVSLVSEWVYFIIIYLKKLLQQAKNGLVISEIGSLVGEGYDAIYISCLQVAIGTTHPTIQHANIKLNNKHLYIYLHSTALAATIKPHNHPLYIYFYFILFYVHTYLLNSIYFEIKKGI